MPLIHCIITGRVQLVMYRDFSHRKARKLGVVGTVQNLCDGSVEVFAQASREILIDYIEYLKTGSALSKVKNVKVEWRESHELFVDFKIIY